VCPTCSSDREVEEERLYLEKGIKEAKREVSVLKEGLPGAIP